MIALITVMVTIICIAMDEVKSSTRISEIPSKSGNENIKFVKPGMLYGISKNTDHPEEAAKEVLISPYYENTLMKKVYVDIMKILF